MALPSDKGRNTNYPPCWIIRTYLPKLVERLDYLGWCMMVNASLHFGIQYCKVLSNCRTTKPTLLKCNKSLYSKHSEIPHSLIFEAGLHLFFLGLMGLNFYRVYLAWNNRNCTNCVEFLGLSWKWSCIHFFFQIARETDKWSNCFVYESVIILGLSCWSASN